MDKVQHYEAKLEEQLSKVPLFKKLEKLAGVPKTYLFLGGSTLVFLSLVLNLGGSLVSDLIGWGFPAYLSLRALDKKATGEYAQWISYWCVFGLINLLEFFIPILSYLIPFYFLIKTGALLWLFLPNYQGADYVYQAFLRPSFLKFNAFLNDTEANCEYPSMSGAADSLRASAAAAAAQVEKAVSDAKKQVLPESNAQPESEAKKTETAAAPEHKETQSTNESKPSTGESTEASKPEDKKDA